MKLFEPYSIGSLRLQNRVVMAPMTRSRAVGGTVVINGGLDRQTAEAAFAAGLADLAAFATGFLANPDLPLRLENDLPLNPVNPETFYTPGELGYTDYPYASVG